MESVQSWDNCNSYCAETIRGQHLLVPESRYALLLTSNLARASSTQRLWCVVRGCALDRLIDFAFFRAQTHRDVTA